MKEENKKSVCVLSTFRKVSRHGTILKEYRLPDDCLEDVFSILLDFRIPFDVDYE